MNEVAWSIVGAFVGWGIGAALCLTGVMDTIVDWINGWDR